MRTIVKNMKRALADSSAALLLGAVAACGSVSMADGDGRVYHCVATDMPVPPPNTWSKEYPLEKFEYGDYEDKDRPTTGRSGYCNMLRVPQRAYLRYRVDGRVIEK